MMNSTLQTLQDYVRQCLPAGGEAATDVPFVSVCRAASKNIQMPETGSPYLYLVLDGILRLYTPSGILDYQAGRPILPLQN